jgi:hypothetical protein
MLTRLSNHELRSDERRIKSIKHNQCSIYDILFYSMVHFTLLNTYAFVVRLEPKWRLLLFYHSSFLLV